jgi:hypothetical protein
MTIIKSACKRAALEAGKGCKAGCFLSLNLVLTFLLVLLGTVCRYAADQLTWLVTRSLGSAPMEVMARLQEDIDECDRKGGRNAAIPADEKVEEWASIVGSCSSRQEVEEVVMPLLADSS